ncbi:MAG: sporulation protein YqfD [Lachnospiraceae bacterium]
MRISVSGFSPERFMNLCTNQNLLLWKVKRTSAGYEMYMTVKGFFCLRPIVRKTGTKVRVLEKRGFPFFMHRYKKHRFFQLGLFVCLMTLWIASCYIWDIRLTGNNMVTDDNLNDFLAEQQVLTGIRKSRIDCEKIEKSIRGAYPQITWVSAKIDGVRLIIEINENAVFFDGKNEEKDTAVSKYHLVSEYDGVVRQIITRSGTPLVMPNAEVKKGDLLVLGEITLLNDAGEVQGIDYVTPDADIIIETVTDYHDIMERSYVKKSYTGEETKSYEYRFGVRAAAFPVFTNYESCDRLTEWKRSKIAALFQKDFWYASDLYKESTFEEDYYSEKETSQLLKDGLSKFIKDLQEKGVQIIENNVTIKITKAAGTASGTLRMLIKNEGKQEIQQ